MIDLNELRQSIRKMTYQQGLYRVLRDELTSLGYWHKLPRGNPSAGYKEMKAKRLKKNA
jgi:protein associated with RNAse G/E